MAKRSRGAVLAELQAEELEEGFDPYEYFMGGL